MLATVLDAVDIGYRVIVVRDAICNSSDEGHEMLMRRYQTRYTEQIRDRGRRDNTRALGMTSDRTSSRLHVLIDLAQRELGERFVGLLFLTERHLQKLHRLVQTEFSGPRLEGPVAGDLVMLDRLRCCQEPCVQGGHMFLMEQKEQRAMASEKNLQELFHETFKDIYFAEKKILGHPSRDGEACTVATIESRLRTTRDRDRGSLNSFITSSPSSMMPMIASQVFPLGVS